MLGFIFLKAGFFIFRKRKKYKIQKWNKGDGKRKMKGKVLVTVGILILILGVATFGPIQVTAAYEHNWSWLTYTPEPAFEK